MYLVTFIDDSNYFTSSACILGIYETEEMANAAIATEKNTHLGDVNHVIFKKNQLNINETNSIEYDKSLLCYRNDLKLG